MSKEFCKEALSASQFTKINEQCPNCDWDTLWSLIQKLGADAQALLQALGLVAVMLALVFSSSANAAEVKVKGKDGKERVYRTGRVQPKNLAAIKRAAFLRNGHIKLPKITAPSWDAALLGICGPTEDQGDCGSCWDFSGCATGQGALIKAGWLKNDSSGSISRQYVLDCGNNGGCGGDDNTTVLAMFKSGGLPLTSDYGPYTASSGRCKTGTWTMYKLRDWGFADGGSGNGVTATQQIKDAIAQYGRVGCGTCAGNDWGDGTQTITGNHSDINHDITIDGWDDTHDNGDGSTGAWIANNSWGSSWGVNVHGIPGRMWIKYGADGTGTETVWAVADPPPAPPSPTPGPTPPSGQLVISSPLAASGAVGGAFSYQIVAGGATSFAAAGLPNGLTCDPAAGLISGTPTLPGSFMVTLSASNAAAVATAQLTLTVAAAPTPGPSGTVTLSFALTDAQIASVLQQAGIENMTIKQIHDKCNGGGSITIAPAAKNCDTCKRVSTLERRLDELYQGVDALLKAEIARSKQTVSPKK